MIKEQIYEVFARKSHEDSLMHVGSVNASDEDLAKVYAWTMYDEENWVEMCVVAREAIIRVTHDCQIPVWGN